MQSPLEHALIDQMLIIIIYVHCAIFPYLLDPKPALMDKELLLFHYQNKQQPDMTDKFS